MFFLGVNLGFKLETEYDREQPIAHDAAAVLLDDHEIVAAVEEERLSRIKHCNYFPRRAIDYCLRQADITFGDVDYVAVNLSESDAQRYTQMEAFNDTRVPLTSARARFSKHFRDIYGHDIANRLVFIRHHDSHAWSTFALSGFRESVVLVLDGAGESGRGDGAYISGLLGVANANGFRLLKEYPAEQSLGHFYVAAIKLIGYSLFDEYKVMGLAPYGDPSRFRNLFVKAYRLEDAGNYKLLPGSIERLFADMSQYGEFLPPRRRGGEIRKIHQDFAAALQEAIETIVFHVVRHARESTGLPDLTYAGGVAHNCTLNGRLRASGLYERIFVQPAAHDAGCALGAAVYARAKALPANPPPILEHLFLGPPLPEPRVLEQRLNAWTPVIRFRKSADVCREAAGLLATDAVIGWVQGRSEFGPRALGNRSILADPRPAGNKARINEMIKKREGYRPFAPSVLEEKAADFFEAQGTTDNLLFMNMIVPVREAWRNTLGAITHVDGTARVQVVKRSANEKYWRLIDEFSKLTGIPILLNTSFNNDNEPIVDSIEEAIGCFLTTDLTHLVIDDYIVCKPPDVCEYIANLTMAVRESLKVTVGHKSENGSFVRILAIEPNYGPRFGGQMAEISPTLFRILTHPDKDRICNICQKLGLSMEATLAEEIFTLWCKRLIYLSPPWA